MPAPALAEARRGQQPIDHGGEGVGRRVGDERRDLLGRRRQAGQVERGAAEQREAVGVGDGLEPLRFEAGEDEAVDVAPRPGGVLHRRDTGGFSGWNDQNLRPSSMSISRRGGLALARVGRAHLDPLLEIRDHRVGQLLLRRHLRVVIGVADRRHQQALSRLAGDERRAAVAALPDALARVEQQPALDLLRVRRVALVALVHQHRANALLEKRHSFTGVRRVRSHHRNEHREDKPADPAQKVTAIE